MSDRTIARWESGEVPIPQRVWPELCAIFGCSVEHLLGLDGGGNGNGGIRRAA